MRQTLFLITLLSPLWLRAEVLDKEVSFPSLLFLAAAGPIVAFWVAHHKPWLLAVLLPILGIFFVSHLFEFADPFVGAAMAREGGYTYVILTWVNPFTTLAAAAIGYFFRVRKAKSAT